MKQNSSRRDFLRVSVGVACAAPLASLDPAASGLAVDKPVLAATPGRIKKAVQINMLPKNLSYADRFKLARDVGFEGVETQSIEDPKEAEEIKKASEDAKLPIHSVMNTHWKFQLSSDDPAVVKTALDGMTTSLHNAKLWGAETVLLVPGVVNANITYRDAWTRSQKNIRTLIPLAKELKIVVALEEVFWNKFLLSPLEMAKYVDEFKSPWIKQYFDVGNVLIYGFPQDWIHTLGKRIVKVHLKDFKMLSRGYSPFKSDFVNLGDGDINWTAVRQAFADIGYTGWATAEVAPGDEAYLRDVVKRIDKLVLGL